MAHMALDHVSLFFNRARFADEFAHGPPPVPADLGQFLTRFSGVFVAPGFSFIAGFMIAVTSGLRAERGLDARAVTRRLVIRGLILIAAEMILLNFPMGQADFGVLSCLGTCMILAAPARQWPTALLLPAALAIVAFHPLLPPVPGVIGRILHDARPLGNFRALYPVIPWIGVMLLGLVCGRDFLRDPGAARRWSLLALISLILFLAVRLPAGYGNAFGYERLASYAFFIWAKYPPDLAWLSWSFAWIFGLLAWLLRDREGRLLNSAPARFVASFGRVPFFFYLIHFCVLGGLALVIAPGLAHRQPLWAVYLLWAALLALLWRPSRSYFAWKGAHPGSIFRFL